jgi:hypothetical protein
MAIEVSNLRLVSWSSRFFAIYPLARRFNLSLRGMRIINHGAHRLSNIIQREVKVRSAFSAREIGFEVSTHAGTSRFSLKISS